MAGRGEGAGAAALRGAVGVAGEWMSSSSGGACAGRGGLDRWEGVGISWWWRSRMITVSTIVTLLVQMWATLAGNHHGDYRGDYQDDYLLITC